MVYSRERQSFHGNSSLFTKPAHFLSHVLMDMFRMVADKLIVNWAEKNIFLCRCIGLLSNNHVVNFPFF